MRRSSVLELVHLYISFETLYGRYDRLLDYLAQPRITIGNRTPEFISKCKNLLEQRIPFDQLPDLGYVPQDSTLFKKRFDLMSTNNRAYAIAVKILPTVPELEEYSAIDPGWSTLFPLKIFLMFHEEHAQAYRGFLPFGSEVKKFYGESSMGAEIKGSPTFKDHVRLQEVTNSMAKLLGCTSVMLNNEMHLEGTKITN